MLRIQVISASAGTGKTQKLATLLEEAVVDGSVRPDAILATTFTNEAAAELEERVRSNLLKSGRVEAARLLRASRIGTVHAVCTRLIMDFAFELGLSPRLRVLDDILAEHALKEALSGVVDKSALDELQDLSSRMQSLRAREERGQRFGGWQAAVNALVGDARSNGITAEQVREASAASWDGYQRLLDPPAPSPLPLEERLREAVGTFVAWAEANDTTSKTRGVLDKLRPIWDRLRGGLPITWADWGFMAALGEPAKASASQAEDVRAAARAHSRHPGLYRDAKRAIELVHETAARALQAYDEHKRTWGVVDFRDQEVLALDLLGRPEARERLADQLDLVLVDEFQDTSPIQLAIFLKLAELARRSVWVGDQKQAIFGFRGTDPALVDAVLEKLSDREAPETLHKSYRSRPELVELTSRLFEQAFADHGLPAERVRVEAERREEPELGPVLERWNILAYNRADRAAALAACVRELLHDPTARVWDKQRQEYRQVQPIDVAVLCRTHATCGLVANALEGLNVRAALSRDGLFRTAEGIVSLAALQALADPNDALAVAQLARFLTDPDAPDTWLGELLSRPYAAAYHDLPAIQRLRALRASLPTAGAVTGLDAALEAVELAELCLRWGDSDQRLANVDHLRALAIEYADHCATTGAGCTPAGLAAHFQALAKAGSDAQARLPRGANAVQLSTWHAAKGREWPIVVLFDLFYTDWGDVLGAHLVDRASGFDLSDPLRGRWVRFWPDPFGWRPRQRPQGMAFWQRLGADPASAASQAQSERQLLRLLYVGWTRARDRLVLAAPENKLTDGILDYLRGPAGRLVSEPGEFATWVGLRLPVRERSSAGRERRQRPTRPGDGYLARGPVVHPPAVRLPSQMLEWGPLSKPILLGEPVAIRGNPEMNRLGEAVHGFLSADDLSLPSEERLALAQGLLERFGVGKALQCSDLLEASRRLYEWLERRFPNARFRREWPLHHRLEGGTLIRGQVDLVVDGADELAIVDHKTISGGRKHALAEAATYAGQLTTYAAALGAALGRPVRSCFFHLPLSGSLVELAPVQLELGV